MNKTKTKYFIQIISASILAIFLAFLIRVIFFQTFIVSNNSMEPTLMDGNEILVVKSNKINRLDIIVFKSRENNSNLVKRVIGIEGDIIEIKNRSLYINNKVLIFAKGLFQREHYIYEVEENSLFVLGDNIFESKDSRHFGSIKIDDVIGKVFLISNHKNNFEVSTK